jgi:hypothetical protein
MLWEDVLSNYNSLLEEDGLRATIKRVGMTEYVLDIYDSVSKTHNIQVFESKEELVGFLTD